MAAAAAMMLMSIYRIETHEAKETQGRST
jgi:hypothetical protein